MHKKVILRLCLIFVFVMGISVGVVYFTFDIRALNYLTIFKPWSVLLALSSLTLGLSFDALRLVTLTQITDEKLPSKDVVKVVLSNYFLALVTPGASGGAIAQIMFMKRAGVPMAKSTMVVFVRTIMSIMFLIIIVPFFIYYDPDVMAWISIYVIATVSVLFTAIPVAAVLLMNTQIPQKILYGLTQHLSHDRRRKCFVWYDDFKQAAFIMGQRPWMVLRAFLESGCSLLFIYAVVPAYFLGLNFDFNIMQVMGRMLLLNLVLYFSPTPGGSGIAEAGFLVLFSKIVPDGTVGILAVLWRFTDEYIPFLLGGILTLRTFGSSILSLTDKHGGQEANK